MDGVDQNCDGTDGLLACGSVASGPIAVSIYQGDGSLTGNPASLSLPLLGQASVADVGIPTTEGDCRVHGIEIPFEDIVVQYRFKFRPTVGSRERIGLGSVSHGSVRLVVDGQAFGAAGAAGTVTEDLLFVGGRTYDIELRYARGCCAPVVTHGGVAASIGVQGNWTPWGARIGEILPP